MTFSSAGNKLPKGFAAGQLQQYTPDQMNLFKSLFSHVSPGSQLSQLASGDESGFAPLEQRAMRDFQTFQGGLASRFSGMGLGGRHGSGFQNMATQGAQDFASQLAEQRQGLQRQALMDLMGISSSLLGQRPYDQFIYQKQKKPSFWESLLGQVSPYAGPVPAAYLQSKGYQNAGSAGIDPQMLAQLAMLAI